MRATVYPSLPFMVLHNAYMRHSTAGARVRHEIVMALAAGLALKAIRFS